MFVIIVMSDEWNDPSDRLARNIVYIFSAFSFHSAFVVDRDGSRSVAFDCFAHMRRTFVSLREMFRRFVSPFFFRRRRATTRYPSTSENLDFVSHSHTVSRSLAMRPVDMKLTSHASPDYYTIIVIFLFNEHFPYSNANAVCLGRIISHRIVVCKAYTTQRTRSRKTYWAKCAR